MSLCRTLRIVRARRRALALAAFGFKASSAFAADHAPTIDVLGSYFPAWLLCMVVALGLTIITHQLLVAWKVNTHLIFPPVVYSCLVAAFAMTVWLLFFRN